MGGGTARAQKKKKRQVVTGRGGGFGDGEGVVGIYIKTMGTGLGSLACWVELKGRVVVGRGPGGVVVIWQECE